MKLWGKKSRRRELATVIDRGRQLLAEGGEQETYQYLRNAVQRFPKDPEVRVNYASILLAIRPNDVAAEAAKAVELGPDNPVILVRAGNMLFDRGDVEAARSCALRASEVAAPDFALLSGLASLNGLLAAVDGDDALAEAELRAAVQIDPDVSGPTIHLAKFLRSRDRGADAIAIIDSCLRRAKEKGDLEQLRNKMATEI